MGQFSRNWGVWGKPPEKIVSTTPFKRSENVGDTLFDLFFETFCRTFLPMAFVLLVLMAECLRRYFLALIEFKLCFQIFAKTCLFLSEECNEHLKNTTK